jgi:hypothetical protein
LGWERQSSLSLTLYGLPSSLGRTHQAIKVPVWEFVYMVVTAVPFRFRVPRDRVSTWAGSVRARSR